jgi:8-oxo-dGTP pyrophosphatase MutT (NUDIX family)
VSAAAKDVPTAKAAAPRLRDAATLILVERTGAQTRVLMGKRHAGLKFLPGKFVFPGGAVEAADRRMSVAGPLDPNVAAKLLEKTRHSSPDFARALALAALRETFEETGLALGVSDCGAPQNPPEGVWARFAATGVYPSLDALDFLARAITPPGRPKRFDARFFVADASLVAHRTPGVVHADAELVELVWTPLDKALELDIRPITRWMLGDLAAAAHSGMDRQRKRPFYRQLRGKAWRGEL